MTEIYQDDCYQISLMAVSQNTTIFNRADFLEHQKDTFNCETILFGLTCKKTRKTLASIDFSCRENESEWRSPVTGAFSNLHGLLSLSFYEMELLIEVTSQFLLNNKGASIITWRTPPLYYNANVNHKLHNVLFRQGWAISASDLNFHLPVSDYATFRKNLAGSKRKELNKITRTQASFCTADSIEDMQNIYDVIKENRIAQGYPMTMSFEALLALKDVIHDDLLFFALKRGDEILAGAIVMNIDSSTCYVFYWGERPCFRHESPVIKLCENLYLYALEHNIEYIDIGISTVYSVPNEGLVNFKLGIGCQISQKLTFSLSN